MKPRKRIKLYHLGKPDMIADFEMNQTEAIFCLQQLNKNLLIQAGGAFNKEALHRSEFYYLAGDDDYDQFCHLVDMANAGNVAGDPKFLTRILEVDGTRKWNQGQPKFAGGRKNPKNKGKKF